MVIGTKNGYNSLLLCYYCRSLSAGFCVHRAGHAHVLLVPGGLARMPVSGPQPVPNLITGIAIAQCPMCSTSTEVGSRFSFCLKLRARCMPFERALITPLPSLLLFDHAPRSTASPAAPLVVTRASSDRPGVAVPPSFLAGMRSGPRPPAPARTTRRRAARRRGARCRPTTT